MISKRVVHLRVSEIYQVPSRLRTATVTTACGRQTQPFMALNDQSAVTCERCRTFIAKYGPVHAA